MIRQLLRRSADFFSKPSTDADEVKTFPVDRLVEQIGIEQTKNHEEVGRHRWNAFQAAIRPGDEIWLFCSPPRTWEALMGSRGLVLLRNGGR
jgi:hypothetical protein